MRKIDTTSTNYRLVADVISTIVGIGAGSLVGAFCNGIIDNSDGTHRQKSMMCLGRDGIKFVTMNSISNEVRKNIDDWVNGWNAIVDIVDSVDVTVSKPAEVVVEEVEES